MSSFFSEDEKDRAEAHLLDYNDEDMMDDATRHTSNSFGALTAMSPAVIKEAPIPRSSQLDDKVYYTRREIVDHQFASIGDNLLRDQDTVYSYPVEDVINNTKNMSNIGSRIIKPSALRASRAMLDLPPNDDDLTGPIEGLTSDIADTSVTIYNWDNILVEDGKCGTSCKRKCKPSYLGRHHCWVDEKSRRYHCYPLLILNTFLLVLALGIIIYSSYKYYPQLYRVHTTCQIVKYDVYPIYCSDGINGLGNTSVYVIFDYSIKIPDKDNSNNPNDNTTDLVEERSESLKICSANEEKGLLVAHKDYPLGSKFDAWYASDDYSDLIFTNPNYYVKFIVGGAILMSFTVSVYILQVIMVKCCHFKPVFNCH